MSAKFVPCDNRQSAGMIMDVQEMKQPAENMGVGFDHNSMKATGRHDQHQQYPSFCSDDQSQTSVSMDLGDMLEDEEEYETITSNNILSRPHTNYTYGSREREGKHHTKDKCHPPCHTVMVKPDNHTRHSNSLRIDLDADSAVTKPPTDPTLHSTINIFKYDAKISDTTMACQNDNRGSHDRRKYQHPQHQFHETDDLDYHIPLEPLEDDPEDNVGRNPRTRRRRGAGVHSQLLKSAFEASMSSYNTEDDDDDNYDSDHPHHYRHHNCSDDDNASMNASTSTFGSQDDYVSPPRLPVTMNVPRKRQRSDEKLNFVATERLNDDNGKDIGRLFGGMILQQPNQAS